MFFALFSYLKKRSGFESFVQILLNLDDPVAFDRSEFKIVKFGNASTLAVAAASAGQDDALSLQAGDTLVSINGAKVGSDGLTNLRDVLARLKQEVDLMMEVIRT